MFNMFNKDKIVKNPTIKQVERMINSATYEEVRGIIDNNDGSVYLRDANVSLHYRIADEMGVSSWTGFIIGKREHDGIQCLTIDYEALYSKIPFLKKTYVYTYASGIIPPQSQRALQDAA